jgi:nicotinamidase-related amidase
VQTGGTVHDDIDGNEIVAMIGPGPRDIVIKKQKPSGFFGTNLASYLTLLGCDSVIVVGTTTSGCVRATAVDAFSLNYRVILAEEGCAGLCYWTGANRLAAVASSLMPARSALGCCAPDLGNPYIASIVRRMLTWVMPLGSA